MSFCIAVHLQNLAGDGESDEECRNDNSAGLKKSKIYVIQLFPQKIDGLLFAIHSESMSGFITNSNSTGDLIAHTTGDVKEAIERTREAEARNLEAYTRRFAGDKDYAKRYIAAKMRRAGGR